MPPKKRVVTLNVDINADMTGFGSARRATDAHHKLSRYYASPMFIGPPNNQALLDMVMHMFTEEEAELVQHLPPLRPRTAEKVAALSGRPYAEVKAILDSLAFTKVVILASGRKKRRYTILPIIPGTFEMVLMTPDLSTRNSWHKGFSEHLEIIWKSGFVADYLKNKREPVRYLPVGSAAKTLNMAWPSDKLEEVIEPFNLFAVGMCQCRMAMQLVGQGCDKPMENCVAIGPMAKPVIARGMMRRADKSEILEIKRKAEEEGCVSFMANETNDWRGNISCSCCGCCCHVLKTISEFNTPGLVSKPHFMPEIDDEKCTLCKKCVNVCPMGALSLIEKTIAFDSKRCIGCGICTINCKFDAMSLEAVDDAMPPEDGWPRLLKKIAPDLIGNSVKVWAKRLFD